MPNRTRGSGATEEGTSRLPRLGSLLVPLDLTPVSDRVVGRLARLPLAPGARITLLHVVPDSLPAGAQRRAERDAKRVLADTRASLVKGLSKGIAVQTVVRFGAAAREISANAAATDADLVVMGRGGERGLRDHFLGSTAERVIRQVQRPVLAVRLLPRKAYQRPALALELDQAPEAVLALALRLLAPPRPSISVIHAAERPYRGLVYPSLSQLDAEEDREHYRQRAIDALRRRLNNALTQVKAPMTEVPAWRFHVRVGDPRNVVSSVVRKEHVDLLALATRGYRGLAHAFLGTVAGDLLRQVTCDVLMVPPPQRARVGSRDFGE